MKIVTLMLLALVIAQPLYAETSRPGGVNTAVEDTWSILANKQSSDAQVQPVEPISPRQVQKKDAELGLNQIALIGAIILLLIAGAIWAVKYFRQDDDWDNHEDGKYSPPTPRTRHLSHYDDGSGNSLDIPPIKAHSNQLIFKVDELAKKFDALSMQLSQTEARLTQRMDQIAAHVQILANLQKTGAIKVSGSFPAVSQKTVDLDSYNIIMRTKADTVRADIERINSDKSRASTYKFGYINKVGDKYMLSEQGAYPAWVLHQRQQGEDYHLIPVDFQGANQLIQRFYSDPSGRWMNPKIIQPAVVKFRDGYVLDDNNDIKPGKMS